MIFLFLVTLVFCLSFHLLDLRYWEDPACTNYREQSNCGETPQAARDFVWGILDSVEDAEGNPVCHRAGASEKSDWCACEAGIALMSLSDQESLQCDYSMALKSKGAAAGMNPIQNIKELCMKQASVDTEMLEV